MFDKFFDWLNVRNCTEHITKQKPFLKPYSSINDERFDWHLHMFLPYFTNWKESIESRPGIYTKNYKARMFLSWQTYEAILITTHSSIELVCVDRTFLSRSLRKLLIRDPWGIEETT